MLLTLTKDIDFAIVPDVMVEEVREEVFYQYKMAAQQTELVCMDTHVVKRTEVQMMRIFYYYDTSTMLDMAIMDDPLEWKYLYDRYKAEDRQKEYEAYRQDVRKILLAAQLFFEQDWTFSEQSVDCFKGIHNSPLQSVW